MNLRIMMVCKEDSDVRDLKEFFAQSESPIYSYVPLFLYASWCSHHCVIPPWVHSGTSDLLLTNRIWQKRWDVTSESNYIDTHVLLNSLWLFHLLTQMNPQSLSYEEIQMTKDWGMHPANRNWILPMTIQWIWEKNF